MVRRPARYALLAALLAAATWVGVRPALSATVAPIRIMALGDSITAGPGCWRAMLWHQLQTTGYTNIDFVGGVSDGGGCNPGYAYDFDHEGHGGFSATGIADNNQLPPWLSAARPDIVLLHLGTNDMWGQFIPTAAKLAAFTKLVGQMRANNPSMKIIVAKIIPMSAASCSTCPADIVEFDAAIPGWATGLSTTASPIIVVDQWTGFDAVGDTVDGVHPNNVGFQKMANRWYPPLAQLLNGVIPPQPTASPTVGPTASASPTPTTTPTSGGRACTASYTVASQWGGTFQGGVTVRNTSATASSAWTATFTFGNGQQITQSWNTTVAQSGASVVARDAGYNGNLAAGATASFGFLASWNNTTNAAPAISCTVS
jgi:lysophospholipase L1-like esterase